MPHHKSCKKRMISSEKEKLQNRSMKSRISTAVKNVIGAKDKDTATSALKTAYSVLDKAVNKNVIHKNKAANKKSQLCNAISKSAE